MTKHGAWIVPIVVFVAIGLAALPYGDGYRTCTSGAWEVEHTLHPDLRIVHQFVPYYSVSCERGWFTMHDGTLADALSWLFVSATVIGVAFRSRRSAVARAAGAAAFVLGVLGLASIALDHPAGAVFTVVVTPIPVLAIERLSGADSNRAALSAFTLPAAVILGWFAGFVFEWHALAVACGIAAAMAIAMGVSRFEGSPRIAPPRRDLFIAPDS